MAEPEHSKPSETGDITSIPISVSAYAQGADPRALALLEYDLLSTISRLYSQNIIYPLILSLPDKSVDSLEELLSRAEVLAENKFIEVATRMSLYLEHGGVELLREAGFEFSDSKESPAQLLGRALCVEPELVYQSVRAIAESKVNAAERTWHIYKASIAAGELKTKLARISNIDFKRDLQKEFLVKDGFGHFCEISGFGVGEEWGRTVTRGCHRPTKPMLDLDEKRAISRLRPMKSDMLIALPESSTIWVGCSSGREGAIYMRALGSQIGDPSVFLVKQDADMSVFMRKDLGSLLGQASKAVGVQRIDLKYIDMALAGSGNFDLPAKRNACLTERYHELPQINEANTMRAVRLRFYTTPKEYFDVTIRDGTIKTNIANSDPVLITNVLSQLKVWTLYSHA